MPNHFHILIHTPEYFDQKKFTDNFKILLSSYTRAINKQNEMHGSLFQQHTRMKCLTLRESQEDAAILCFHYIHQNPVKAGLANKMEDWEMSSFRDYVGKRKTSICNLRLACDMLCLPSKPNEFYDMSYEMCREDIRSMLIQEQ